MLFVEKEGFKPLLRAARIAERFDCAPMSTKGMSVIAARELVEWLSAQGVRILVAHDFDRSGFVDINDLGMLASNWQGGGGGPPLGSFGLAAPSVPEPAFSIILPISLIVSRRRRR